MRERVRQKVSSGRLVCVRGNICSLWIKPITVTDRQMNSSQRKQATTADTLQSFGRKRKREKMGNKNESNMTSQCGGGGQRWSKVDEQTCQVMLKANLSFLLLWLNVDERPHTHIDSAIGCRRHRIADAQIIRKREKKKNPQIKVVCGWKVLLVLWSQLQHDSMFTETLWQYFFSTGKYHFSMQWSLPFVSVHVFWQQKAA